MTLSDFLNKLKSTPDAINFQDTLAVIEAAYDFTETAFKNGDAKNAMGQNSGSCKIFAFAQLNALTQAQTLSCFGDYYRKDVLENSTGTDHSNIRNFMASGWDGIMFEAMPLVLKGNEESAL